MDENILIKACIKQNRAAQQELYQRFASEMLGVCYRYTKSMDDAEDVLQEGFVKVFANLKQYSGSGALGGWIYRIMVRTALNYLRHHARYRNNMTFDTPAVHPVSEDTITSGYDTEALIELIRKLPVGYQTVFNMVGIEGYSHEEVAEMLQININTSRSQYSRARAQLMKWINEETSINSKTKDLK